MAVTIRDIARRLNISHTTVSRALNGRTDINIPEITRQRVRQVANELGYRPNTIARALMTGRTQIVALAIPELETYHSEIARHFHHRLAGCEYEMIISHQSRRMDSKAIPLVNTPLPVDGVIVVDWPDRFEGSNGSVQAELSTPYVSIGTYPCSTTDFVVVDLKVGARQAMRHLLDQGCRQIASLIWSKANKEGDARRDAYAEAMQAAGLQPRYYNISTPDRLTAFNELDDYLRSDAVPEALFCFNDDIAIGAYRCLQKRGLRVPEDVLICGCDGLADMAFLPSTLSTIKQPIEEMCEIAWNYLRQRMEDLSRPLQQLWLPSALEIRESTTRPT